MINIKLKLDEEGKINYDEFTNDLFILSAIDGLINGSYRLSSELNCLLRCEEVLKNGPNKYILQMVSALTKYELEKNNRLYLDNDYSSTPNEERDTIIDTRKRIHILLEKL